MTRHRKQPYPYVTAWGHLQGLRDYSIEAQVAQAVVDGAPKDAIFRDTEGVWRTLAELERQAPELRAKVEGRQNAVRISRLPGRRRGGDPKQNELKQPAR